MKQTIHTIRQHEDLTIEGFPARVRQTDSGLSVVGLTGNSPAPDAITIRDDGLVVPLTTLESPEKRIFVPPHDSTPPDSVESHVLNQAEMVRFCSNPLLYVRNKLIDSINEPTVPQKLLIGSLFEGMDLDDDIRTMLVQPKVTTSDYFDKRAGKRLPVEHTGPSDFEEMATKILEILSTVGDIPNTPGAKLVLAKLTSFGVKAIKAHAHTASEYSQDIISLRGGQVYKAGYSVLEKSVIDKDSRRELYRFLDLFEVSIEFAESILERMDDLGDLETPLASRLLINVLHKSGEYRTPFVQEQIRRARIIKEVYEESTPLERGSYQFMSTMCDAARKVVFDIEALETRYGKKVGIEVEYIPRGKLPIPDNLTSTRISGAQGPVQYEIRTTNENIEMNAAYLLRIDELRRYLELYAHRAKGSSHMHFDQRQFERPQPLLGTVECCANPASWNGAGKAATWELKFGLPIDLFHENNLRTFINFLLFHSASMEQINEPLDIQIVNTQHARWLALERVPTRTEGLIAKLQALETDTLSSIIGNLKPISFFEAWSTLPVKKLLSYLLFEEGLHATQIYEGFEPRNIYDFLQGAGRPLNLNPSKDIGGKGLQLLLQQYGPDTIRSKYPNLLKEI